MAQILCDPYLFSSFKEGNFCFTIYFDFLNEVLVMRGVFIMCVVTGITEDDSDPILY